MGRIIARIGHKAKGLFGSLRDYPLESALCITYFVIYVIQDVQSFVEFDAFFVWFVPHLVLCFTLHQFKERHILLKVLFYLSWFAWIPFLLWFSYPNSLIVIITYFLTCVALIIGTRPMDNVAFGRRVLNVVIRLAEGIMVGLLMWGVVFALVSSVDFLFFDTFLDEEWYSYPSVFVWLVFTPLLCCVLLGESTGIAKGKNLLQLIIDWILSPALVVYAAVLYAYIIRILVNWELPDGGVAYWVLVFLSIALVCYLLRLQVENRHFEWFYNAFPAIALPPLALLWTGIFRRIGEYGLTEPRFYLLVFAVLMTVFVAMLVDERFRRFQLMVLMMAIAAILFTFIPGIRAKDFCIRNQISRLDKLLPEVLEDGRFPEEVDYYELARDSVRCKTFIDCSEAWSYLKGEMDPESFKEQYGALGKFPFDSWDSRSARYNTGCPDEEEMVTQSTCWSMDDISGNIDLGPYTQIVYSVFKQADSLGVAFCSKNDPADTLLYYPVRKRLEGADENTPAEEILIYENGRYKAVFWTFMDKDTDPSDLAFATSALFKKPE